MPFFGRFAGVAARSCVSLLFVSGPRGLFQGEPEDAQHQGHHSRDRSLRAYLYRVEDLSHVVHLFGWIAGGLKEGRAGARGLETSSQPLFSSLLFVRAAGNASDDR